MKQVLVKKGNVFVDEVPSPMVVEHAVLVKVYRSLISTGTELAGVQASAGSLVHKALKQPEKVRKVLRRAKREGIAGALRFVEERLNTASETGYSSSGVVVEAGEGVGDLRVGDRVACAGQGHAEIVCVPKHLTVPLPAGVGFEEGAFVGLGAIAIQGVRRSDARLGECVVVIGLGLIGQLTVQILKAGGCRVIGMDLDRDRIDRASQAGCDVGFVADDKVVQNVMDYTDGIGADAVIICAAAQSNAPVEQALAMARKKGKVVVVGAVPMNLPRPHFYQKELDFLISTSYGPGRYDPRYEQEGLDYPIAYVRWTERRNMEAFLRLVGEKRVRVDTLVDGIYPIDEAPAAYTALRDPSKKPLALLLKYTEEDRPDPSRIVVSSRPVAADRLRVAVIGCGGFAKSVHLPNLKQLQEYDIAAMVSRTGSNAKQVAQRYGARYATTDYREVLEDEHIDMVLIATRHNLHAQMAMEAAQAGKAVFLEKPMALHREELDALVRVLQDTGVPFMVGFNRRFSPAARRTKRILEGRKSPLMVLYRVNAGYIPAESWVHTEEGGGRIIGEACHMFDFFNYIVGSANVVEVCSEAIVPNAKHIRFFENVTVSVRYEEDSVCTLLYTSLGAKELPKEYVEIYADGKTLVIDDYRELSVYGAKAEGWRSTKQDKGHMQELKDFARYMKGKVEAPITLEELVAVTKVTFQVNGQGRETSYKHGHYGE